MKLKRSLLFSISLSLLLLAYTIFRVILPLQEQMSSMRTKNSILQQQVQQAKKASTQTGDGLNSEAFYQWWQHNRFADLQLQSLSENQSEIQVQIKGQSSAILHFLTWLPTSQFSQFQLSDLNTPVAMLEMRMTRINVLQKQVTPLLSQLTELKIVLPKATSKRAPPPGMNVNPIGTIRKNNLCYQVHIVNDKTILQKGSKC